MRLDPDIFIEYLEGVVVALGKEDFIAINGNEGYSMV